VRTFLLGLAVVLAVALPATAAGAHGDEGRLEVVSQVPSPDGQTVTFTVELTYANDGDPVEGATVTATLRTPGGSPPAPVVLTPAGPGSYTGEVLFPGPGQWRVRIASTDPAAEVEATYRAPEAPPPTTPSTTLPPADTPATTAPAATGATLADDGDGGGGPPAALVLGLVVAGAALVAGGVLAVLRRRPV
jgi:hypothetical protein